jgi:hypothetical protein
MNWAPAEKVLETVAAQRQALAKEDTRIAAFNEYHAAERHKINEEKHQAVHDLGQAILPTLDARSIATAAETVGLVGLPSEDIPAQVVGRRAWLEARLTEILRDPRYANREMLRHPRTGSLSTAIAEAEDFRRSLTPIVSTCDEHPMFEHLWTSGYGTPAHKAAWWRYSYWQERAAADDLVAKLPGKTTFAEVRDEYTRAKDTIAVYDADLAGLHAEVAAGKSLDAEYATLYEEHRTLDACALEYTRGRIVQHLLTSEASLVSQRLRPSSALLLLFLRASGLTAKVSYLDGIHKSNIGEMERDLATQRERLDGVEARTRKRWLPMPIDKFHKLAEDRQLRREKRWQRFGKVYKTVYVYDRWDRGRGYDDLLWWDLMTRGRYDGSYVPEVALFHERHPDYAFDPDWKTLAAEAIPDRDDLQGYDTDTADAAAAAAGAEADRGADDMQTTDAS